MIIESKFKFGDILKDKITSYRGTVMVVAKYHTGCISYGLLTSKLKDNGEIPDRQWIDECRLELVDSKHNLFHHTVAGRIADGDGNVLLW